MNYFLQEIMRHALSHLTRSTSLRIGKIFALYSFILSLFSINLSAQNFINAQLTTVPPYSLYLMDYAMGSNIQLNLVQRDVTREPQEVYLNIELEGAGISLKTLPSFRPSTYIDVVQGGMLFLTNSDLAEYFSINSLSFEGISKEAFVTNGQQLPEGLYKLKVKAILKSTGSLASNEVLSIMGLFKGQPPFINLPMNNSKVNENPTQNFSINWTNRNSATFNQANLPSYRLQMWELLDPSQDPNIIVNSNYPPILDDFTNMTTYQHGLSNTALTAGKVYALRVQVLDPDGRDVYSNGGYSQVVKFTYGDACNPPTNLTATLDTRGIVANWALTPNQGGYRIQYGRIDTAWTDADVLINRYSIENTYPSAQYQMRVATVCAAGKQSEYSEIVYISTTPSGPKNGAACGDPFPKIEIKNQKLLPSLKVGDKFTAFDFDVTVTQVSRNDSNSYKGEGKTPFMMLGGMDVVVYFDGITINTDHQMFGPNSKVKFQQKPYVLSDKDLKQFKDDFKDTKEMATGNDAANPETVNVDVTIGTVSYDSTKKQIIINDAQGNTVKTLTSGKDYKITDKDGNVFVVSKDNKITKQTKATETAVKNGGPADGGVNTDLYFGENSTLIGFSAHPQQILGFDAKAINSWGPSSYEYVRTYEGQYDVAYKAVPSAGTDKVVAKLQENPKGIQLNRIKFKTNGGQAVPFDYDSIQKQWTLTITGALHRQDFSIFPYYGNGKDTLCGKLNVMPFDRKEVNMVLVPLNGYKTAPKPSDIEAYLNKIYLQANIQYKVTLDKPFSSAAADLPLSVEHGKLEGEYSENQASVITDYMAANEEKDNTVYLFLCKEGSNSAVKGHTPVNRSYGFLFGESIDSRTIAHEVGHGYPLALEHPFSEGGANGIYTSLMDYSTGTNLSFKQWVFAHNPKLKVRFGQNSEQGEYVNEIHFTPDWQAFIFKGNFLLSPNPKVPKGTVPNIVKDKKLYRAVFAGDKFLYYAYSETDILALDIKPNPKPTDEVYLLESVGQYSCYNVYKSSFQNINALKGASIDFNSRNLTFVYNTNGCENKDKDITPLGQEVLNSLKFYYSDPKYAQKFARLTALVKKMAVGFDLYFSKAVLQNNSSILFNENYLDELIGALEGQLGKGDIVKIINDPNTTPEQLLSALNLLGSELYPELSYASYSVDQRIKMLQIFAKGKIRDEWIGFGNNAEAHVIWILKYTPQNDFPELLKKLEIAKDATGKKNLLYVVDSQMDGDKYMELLTTITQIIVTSSDFKNRGEDYQSHFVDRILNWGGDAQNLTDGYVRVKEGVWSNYVKMNEQTGEISVEREERYKLLIKSKDEYGVSNELMETYSRPYKPDIKMRPFDLVAFTNHGGLLEIDGATGAKKGEQVYLPAIALVYANAKEFNDNVGKTVNYTIDAATLIGTGGTLTFAYHSLGWTRKAWLMYELVSTAGNITVNALELDKDPNLKTAVDMYNVVQTMLGASELIYEGRKSAPAALLKSGKATLASVEAVKEQAKKFMLAVSKIKDEGMELSLEAKRAKEVCKKYSNELQTKWKTWFGEDFNDKLILNNPLGLFTDDLDDLVITLDKSDDLIKVRKWIGNVSDGKVYIAVHGDGNLFKIMHNGQEYSLSHRSVARWITENKTITPNAEIVLLSCANERAAQNLSNALKGNYKITSWDEEVTVFANGHIQGSGKCYAYQPSSTSGYNRTEIASANAPYGSNRSNAPPNTEFVVLGRKFGLYAKLDADHKATYDALVKAGLKAQKDGNLVRFVDVDGLEVISMAENKVLVKKWGVEYESKGTKIQTATGYIILINGKSITVDIGFKEGRKLSAEEVNDYLINGQRKDPGEPYKKGTEVVEIILGKTQKDEVHFIENFNFGEPNPGQFGSNGPIYTLEDLRQKLAVKEAWKETRNEPTLRSYFVIAPLRTRSGIIGPQTDNGIGGVKLAGGGHQYEVIDYLGKDWGDYLINSSPKKGIKLVKATIDFNSIWINNWTKKQLVDKFNSCFDVSSGKPKRVDGYTAMPKPSTYLKKDHITYHYNRFKQEGAAFIVVKEWMGRDRLPPRKFAGLKSEMDAVIEEYEKTKDWKVLRDRLNLDPTTDLSQSNICYVTISPNDPRFDFDMPDGNEFGAIYNEWMPGGYTKDGTMEAAIVGSEKVEYNKDVDKIIDYFGKSKCKWIKLYYE